MTNQMQSIHERIMTARRATDNGRGGLSGLDDAASSRRRWLRPLLYGTTCAILLAGGGFGLYQFPVFAETAAQQVTGKPKAAPQPAPRRAQPDNAATPAAAATAPADLFLTHANELGVKTCAATYAGLGKALTEGTQFTVQTQTAKADADRYGVQGVVGMAFPSGKGGYSGTAAGIVFAAPTAQGCEGDMVRVVPFAQNCQAAAAFLPKGSQPLQPLSGIAIYALSTGGQAMLMPSGNGCVAISILRSTS
ncbi:hypothetical protein [Methylobacterium nodulans]|uniref:Uncharacterized protein n=1 Tax=Methylobacterium nodulans (strain LMG 21967 / CNCM I-2342 / ORS 2060) TaxID=460265 RepID=B8IW41_METNO|nr:hypothetical protein [Methylobacterium nodulans]ACL62631.1 conserved hypothetical protein [Methylobacterium nodulans ORS 2060]